MDEINRLYKIADELMKRWDLEIRDNPDSGNVDVFYSLSNEIREIASRLNKK